MQKFIETKKYIKQKCNELCNLESVFDGYFDHVTMVKDLNLRNKNIFQIYKEEWLQDWYWRSWVFLAFRKLDFLFFVYFFEIERAILRNWWIHKSVVLLLFLNCSWKMFNQLINFLSDQWNWKNGFSNGLR